MFKQKLDEKVQPGDRFKMHGKVDTVWVVKKLLEFKDMPEHLHLTPESEADPRILTYAVSAVLDQKLFKKMAA